MSQKLLLDLADVAEFSSCRNWRYTLHRRWDDGPTVGFIMFNPSTADETQDDPTIRRCIGFAQRWGYGQIVILNLFAIRGTDPRIVRNVADPIGPQNDFWIVHEMTGCRELICAWGCGQWMKGELAKRPASVLSFIRSYRNETDLPIRCLGVRQDGHPRHPLMLPYTAERVSFEVQQ
jgi:hypothetical protein